MSIGNVKNFADQSGNSDRLFVLFCVIGVTQIIITVASPARRN